MLFVRAGQTLLLVAALAVSPAFAGSPHAKKVSSKHGRHLHLRIKRSTSHSQRVIDSARATEIQTALIHQNYLSGVPSGQWDSETQTAMQKYQSDHGWQTKLMPDSRALISLGLGPSQPADLPAAKTASAPTVQAPAASEPAAANTLASVHSISQ